MANLGSYLVAGAAIVSPFLLSGHLATIFILLMSVPLVALLASSRSAFWTARPLVWLGVTSYALYMVHVHVFTLTARFLVRPGSSPALIHAALVGGVLVATCAAHYLVEKPCREASRRIGKRFTSAHGPSALGIASESASVVSETAGSGSERGAA